MRNLWYVYHPHRTDCPVLQMSNSSTFAGSEVLYAWETWKGHRSILQNIIDARALSLIAEHGDDAEAHVCGRIQRLQWKLDVDEDLRAKRILKSIRRIRERGETRITMLAVKNGQSSGGAEAGRQKPSGT